MQEKQLNGDDVNTVSPTLGFKITTFQYYKYSLNLWDVGGQKSLRSYWKNYFESTDGLVWVVDCADTMRMEICHKELHALLQEERLVGATLLVLANKQDLPGAIKSDQLAHELELSSIKTHNWRIFPVCALNGENLIESFDWLITDIASRIYLHA